MGNGGKIDGIRVEQYFEYFMATKLAYLPLSIKNEWLLALESKATTTKKNMRTVSKSTLSFSVIENVIRRIVSFSIIVVRTTYTKKK